MGLTHLNENQRQAIEWPNGPLLVLAGPGSGKTLVLTMRIARLLQDTPDERFRILGLTFTNKAAGEMRERVIAMVPHCEDRVLLTTFHAFSAEILRQHGTHVGLRPDFVILNQEADRKAVLRDVIRVLNERGAAVTSEDIRFLPTIDHLLTNCTLEEDVPRLASDPILGEKLALLYSEYRNQLVANNRLDFSSLIAVSEQLLRTRLAIARQLQITYPYICIDEFQDTNLAQYRLLQALVGADFRNLFVVADDDQIIYQWNGASPERLRSLRVDFRMSVIQLPANYRCPPEVVQLANNLIQHNPDRVAGKEPLFAAKASDTVDLVRLHAFPSYQRELSWVAEDIAENRANVTGECVILARTRRILDVAAEEVEKTGLTASLALRKNEFSSAPLRWLHATLRLANARGDQEQLRRMSLAFKELAGLMAEVGEVTAFAPGYGNDYLRSWLHRLRNTSEVPVNVLFLLDVLNEKLLERPNVVDFCQYAFAWIESLAKDFATSAESLFPDYADERETWTALQGQIMRKVGTKNVTLNLLLQELDLNDKSPSVPRHAVRCMTIHSAKGMEFNHVYLVGLAECELPSYQAVDKGATSQEMQEERRNCFVAITRAQTTLTLTYANTYFGWKRRPSRFLGEMGLAVSA